MYHRQHLGREGVKGLHVGMLLGTIKLTTVRNEPNFKGEPLTKADKTNTLATTKPMYAS